MSWAKSFKNEDYPHGTFQVGAKFTVPNHARTGRPLCSDGEAPHEHTILQVHEGPRATMVIFDGEILPGPPDHYVFVVPPDLDSRTPVTLSPSTLAALARATPSYPVRLTRNDMERPTN